jgi:hypothetical protein
MMRGNVMNPPKAPEAYKRQSPELFGSIELDPTASRAGMTERSFSAVHHDRATLASLWLARAADGLYDTIWCIAIQLRLI